MKRYVNKIGNFWDRCRKDHPHHIVSLMVEGNKDLLEREDRLNLNRQGLEHFRDRYECGKFIKSMHYDKPFGVIEFIRNCFEHLISIWNAYNLEDELQAIFPEVLGMIHYELYILPEVI
ncbi:hypothetical protein COLO4_31605, partial [Corchorus olitorius]